MGPAVTASQRPANSPSVSNPAPSAGQRVSFCRNAVWRACRSPKELEFKGIADSGADKYVVTHQSGKQTHG